MDKGMPAPGGPRDWTGDELLRALDQPGCPICALTEQQVARFLEAIAYEAVTDPDARRRLRDSLGYCAAHGRQWLGLQNTLGTAILYRDYCEEARETLVDRGGAAGVGSGGWRGMLAGLRGQGSEAGRALAAALEPSAPCPGCRQTAEVEAQGVAACIVALGNPAFLEAYQRHPMGLCLPHFRAVLRRLGDPALLRALIDAQIAHLAATSADLAEVARKYDYRFHREPHGAEFEAPARSVEQISGRLPTQLNPPKPST
jgi:Family of unknown function (DUF6062)